ncbi:MAG: RluA family pseudouridine synthase [Bacteroidota bacterium]
MKKFSLADSILFENDNFLIINKPAGLSTLEDRNDGLNLLKSAKAYYEDLLICHRLDKDTSGAIAFAKNEDAHRHLSMQFENRKVKKIYHAMVDGIHEYDQVKVDKPIKVTGKGTVRIDFRQGKQSLTYFNSLEGFKMHTLVECIPHTGRTHQIRIHLADLRSPITGDLNYGGRLFYLSSVKRNYNLKKWTEEQPIMSRMALHAFSLEFSDVDDKNISVEAPYPKDFRVLVEQMRKNK